MVKTGRPKINVKADILKLLSNSARPLSTSDLCGHLSRAWHTVDRACLMLQIDGKVDGFKVGKMNLWQLSLLEKNPREEPIHRKKLKQGGAKK